MTNRLVIHFPNSSITIECDDRRDEIEILTDFCKKSLGAYHATEDIDELFIKEIDGKQSNELHSLMFELGIF